MAKRYDEPIALYMPQDRNPFFIWQRRRYDVVRIVNRWVRTANWWKGSQAIDNQYFKVLAKPAREEAIGLYELCYDQIGKAWRLLRVLD